jgi:hypothetical protein
MAAPNIVNVTTIIAGLAVSAPANTTANVVVSNAASSAAVIKINSLTCTNVTGTSATTTVSITSSAAGAGTAYRLAFQISIPANSSLQLIDKGNFVYLTEDKSLVVTSGTSSAIEYVTSYETIS